MTKHLFLILVNLAVAIVLTLALVGALHASTLACAWAANNDGLSTLCNVGIGLLKPGQRLHVADGNILLEGGGETALQIKRDVTFTRAITLTHVLTEVSQNPLFQIGRIIQAGDSDPELRILYSDDHNSERAVMELDRKGIIASVKQDRGSHYEGFISSRDREPIFRLNSYPKMRLEMGNGGSTPVDVAVQRETTNTLTLITGATESARITPAGIEVSNGYLRLATTATPPPANDCAKDHPEHVGRMKMDSTYFRIYVCTTAGWGWAAIFTTTISLPVITR
jgi:hypothetical protein